MYKKKVFIWCCDLSINSGEGIIANKFINELKINNKNFKFKIFKPKKNRSILFQRLIHPFQGLFYLWFIYLSKKNKEICYVNYLPFWNFLLFMLLPPKIILGPVTGGSLFGKKPFLNFFLRKYILNFLNIISYLIINIRKKKLLFSTDLLKNKLVKKNDHYFNYVLNNLKIKNYKIKKDYDLIFYLRDHKNKETDLQIYLAKELAKKYKIITVGEKINYSKIKNLGYVPRKILNKILKKTKFAFLSPENLYSLFAIDSISSNTNIFFNKYNNYKSTNLEGIYYINYSNKKELITKIENQLNKKFKFNIKYKPLEESFLNYFKL